MNVGLVMLMSLAVLAAGYVIYGRFVAAQLGVDAERPTPAVTREDGVDFVPTQPLVLFGHHFASIAAAGPIVGPTLALMFGFLPAWAWVVVGVVLIGAVHDFSALFVSVREGGQSVAEVARKTLGTGGFLLYAAFAVLLCVLVSAAFLDLTAKSLTALYPVAALGLPADQTLLGTVQAGGQLKAKVGGIASTSVVIITLAAPLLGWLLYRRRMNPWVASAIAFALCTVSILIGFGQPLSLDGKTWIAVILAYTLVAGFIPVWIILQPRDFVNVQLLYVGLVVLFGIVIGCGLHGATVDLPMYNAPAAAQVPALGTMWPFLFVTIACGSVSGAHGLICGGTTCKQLSSERHARTIGYGGMLLEGALAICVILVIAAGLGFDAYRDAVWKVGAPGAPVAFAVAVGRGLWRALGSPESGRDLIAYGTVFGIILLEGFLITTIDTVIRLSRYLLEEVLQVWLGERMPSVLRNRAVTTLCIVAPVAILAYTSGYQVIWPLFGASNQLLAALTLTAVSVWLWQRGKVPWFTAIPALFMTVTTVGALVTSLARYLRAGAMKPGLAFTAALLLALALGVVLITLKKVGSRGAALRAAR